MMVSRLARMHMHTRTHTLSLSRSFSLFCLCCVCHESSRVVGDAAYTQTRTHTHTSFVTFPTLRVVRGAASRAYTRTHTHIYTLSLLYFSFYSRRSIRSLRWQRAENGDQIAAAGRRPKWGKFVSGKTHRIDPPLSLLFFSLRFDRLNPNCGRQIN